MADLGRLYKDRRNALSMASPADQQFARRAQERTAPIRAELAKRNPASGAVDVLLALGGDKQAQDSVLSKVDEGLSGMMMGYTMQSGRYVPDYLVEQLQRPRVVPKAVGRPTKDSTVEMLNKELPASGGIVRMTNVDELTNLLSGVDRIGKNFEQRPGISAAMVGGGKPIVRYGRDDGISASMVLPENSVARIGEGVNEVKINPNFSRHDTKYGISDQGLFSWDELKELFKAELP